MCHDGNSAPLSVRYLNSQLSALWANADQCVKEATNTATDVKSSQYEKSKYTRALAQFHYFGRKAPKVVQSSADFAFYATFAKPEIKFVCNHDAVFFLKINEGHANLEYSKVISGNSSVRVDARKNRPLKNVKVAFRLEFDRSNLKGRDSRIGNADSKHVIQMLILKFETAKLVKIDSEKSLDADTKDALKAYLTKYLEFLRHAGNHVLFDLPDFDDDKYSPKIDYSQHRETFDLDAFCGGIQLKSFSLDEINEFLYKKWAMAKRLALDPTEDALSVCLAELDSHWIPNPTVDDHFFIQFKAPRVKALCSQEVILYFEISNIWFFDGEDYEVAKRDFFENWTVAYIVDVSEYKVDSVTQVKLNFETARISRLHSTWAATATKFFDVLVRFLNADYFDILLQYSLDIVYQVDVRATGILEIGGVRAGGHISDSASASWSDDSDEEGRGAGGVVIRGSAGVDVRVRTSVSVYSSIIFKMDMFGFDQVTALSEEAMNFTFASLYRDAAVKGHADYNRIYHWSKAALFTATFGGITVHLLSGNKALILVTIDSGDIAIKKQTQVDTPWKKITNYIWPSASDAVTKIDFEQVVLGYMVDIKMVDGKDLSTTEFSKRFEHTDVYQTFRSKAWYAFKHVILDVRNAIFINEASVTTSLGRDDEGVIRLRLIQDYAKEYLTQLADGGYHVVQSLPILTRPDQDFDSCAFTSIAFQVLSKDVVTIQNWSYKRNVTEAPTLLIYGMCGGRPMPNALIRWVSGWVIPSGKRTTFGTICLSREVFLQGRVLSLLEIVNRKTTLVPKFAGVIDGEWHYDLHLWEADVYRKNRKCAWKLRDTGATDALEYVWEHRDEWSHEHEGTGADEKNGEYSLACRTKNKLIIPTAYRSNDLKIVISGESSIRIKGKADHQHWSRQTTATWEASIVVYSKPYGLVVNVVTSSAPKFVEATAEGICSVNVLDLHKRYLGSIDLSDIERSLKQVLSGSWEYAASSRTRYALSQPVFTRSGDIVMQLMELKKSTTAGALNGNGAANGNGALSYSQATSSPALSRQVSSMSASSVTSSRTTVIQSAKVDLSSAATFGNYPANNGAASSASSLLDSPPLKTPSLDPAAPTFNPSAKAVPGFNAGLKTASVAKPTKIEEEL